MKRPHILGRHGRKLVPAIALLALAAFFAVFHRPILDWFGVGAAADAPPAPAAGPAPSHPEDDEDEVDHYTCPMHPSVRTDSPGACPICGMDLAPIARAEVESGAVVVDAARRQHIGVRTAEVERRPLALEVRALGTVTYDETRLTDVSLRTSGWVERLRVDAAGQHVRRGQVLFTLYSPELYAAELEHLAAVRRGEPSAALTRTSRRRLELLGMTGAQIDALERRGEALEEVPVLAPATGYVVEKNVVEGAAIEAGAQVFRIADLGAIWIDAQVYEADLPHVRVGQVVEVELPFVPARTFEGRVDYLYPTLDARTRTARLRVVLPNDALSLRPNMYADVRIEVELGERLAVPESAVIYTGPRRLVFVDHGEGRLTPREVKVGVHTDGYYEVTEGLAPGDVVVTSGNFLVAAESRLRSATTYWEGSRAAE